jgi:hypothetical protein
MKLGSLALIKRGTARSGDRGQTAEGVVAVTFQGRITQPKRMTTQIAIDRRARSPMRRPSYFALKKSGRVEG